MNVRPAKTAPGDAEAPREKSDSGAEPPGAELRTYTVGGATLWLSASPAFSLWRGEVNAPDRLRVETRDGGLFELRLEPVGVLRRLERRRVRHDPHHLLRQRGAEVALYPGYGLCYGGLQNLTLIVAFAAVGPRQLPTASAVWNIGFDTGTASGAVLAGVLATAYSFPVSLATMAAFCLLTAVVAVIVPSPRRTTRR